MNLEQLQRAVFEVTRQPLTPSEKLRSKLPDGRSVRAIADVLIKPNDRMTSFERLEVYSQQYWFRILDSLREDFPGLCSVVGERRFTKLAVAYLNECPSESFTLRNLGARLEAWLGKNSDYIAGVERLAMDMVRLEWAEIEAFDQLELPRLTAEGSAKLNDGSVLHLQPHLQLLALAYPADGLLFRIRGRDSKLDAASNAVLKFLHRSGKRRHSLPRPRKVYLAVYRLEGTVYFKRLTRDAFTLVKALGEGKSIGEAIEFALVHSRHNPERLSALVQSWFKDWSSLGWFSLGS